MQLFCSGHTNVLTLVSIISRMFSTMGLNKTKQQLFSLIKRDAYCEGNFRLSSGKMSSYYIDCRKVTLSSEGALLAGRLIVELIKGKDIDAIGGPTIGADPIVGAASVLSLLKYKKPLKAFLVRKHAKGHGMQQQLEGPPLPKGSRVVVIDDVATSGGSLLDAIAVLKQQAMTVVMVIVLVDRNEGAKEKLQEAGCALHSIFNIDDFKSKKPRRSDRP